MPHAVTSLKRPSSYSHCPLKKRPLKYDPDDFTSDSDLSSKGVSPIPLDHSEPENLSTKPEDLRLTGKEKSLPSPPPISLVAGRGDGNPLTSHPQYYPVESDHFGEKNLSNYGQPAHSHKSNGPLGPINLNAPWPKINPYMPLNNSHPNPTTGINRSAFEPFATSGPVLSRTSQTPSVPYPSQFTPIGGYRESGSPPHVSPPLSHEPAYPVLRIEENHRSRITPSQSYEDLPIKREMFSPPQHTRYPNMFIKQENFSSHQEYKEFYGFQPVPSQSPEKRESVINHGNEKRNSPTVSPNAAAIVPTNVNGSVRYQCPDCCKSYSTYSGLSKHMQFHCASQNTKSFVCKFCEKVYVSLGALKMHIRTHTLPCKCDLCGKAFSRPWLLQGHIRTHTGEKPFTCQHCHRSFADRSNLRAHLQTHSEVKKYSCKCCSKTFSRMSLLTKHEEGGCTSILPNSE